MRRPRANADRGGVERELEFNQGHATSDSIHPNVAVAAWWEQKPQLGHASRQKPNHEA